MRSHDATRTSRKRRGRRFISSIPMAWIEESLAATGTASIRKRRLPAEQVMYLEIAMPLFSDQAISRVLETLGLATPGDDSAVSRCAITKARRRLGPEPLENLFHRTSQDWSAICGGDNSWKDLSIWAMDGTTFRAPDSTENRSTFGGQEYASGVVSSYPQIRAVSLTSLSTRLVMDIAFGEYGKNEVKYAKTLLSRIPDHSLTVFDKGFSGAAILVGLRMSGENRHFLIPAKVNFVSTLIKGTEEDGIVQMKVTPQARHQNPELPDTWTARAVKVELPDGQEQILLTSLTDRRRFKAEAISEWYGRRWGVETSFQEIKNGLLHKRLTLRSQDPQGIRQELWGTMIAYNLVRLSMAKLAAKSRENGPTDISFASAVHLAKCELMMNAPIDRMCDQLKDAKHEKRRGRRCPRRVKLKPRRYEIWRVFGRS